MQKLIGASHSDGPWRLTFDTNPDQCNQRCIMCEEHSPYRTNQGRGDNSPPRIMPIGLIRKVVADAVPLGLKEIIPSTMGEPLLYESFDEIIDLCHQYGLKLNLTTNGSFPRLSARIWAKKIVPVASDIKISWNGATKQTHEQIMLGSDWDCALENARTLIEVRDQHVQSGGQRCRITFQTTFLETNVSELAAMVKLAIDLGVDRVKGHHLWCHFDEIRDLSMRRSPEAIQCWNRSVVEAQKVVSDSIRSGGKGVVLENLFLLDPDEVEDLTPGGYCPFIGQEAWVSAEGEYSPCCAPNELRRTLGEFGNVNKMSLSNIWNSDSYRHLVANYQGHPLCVSCNMRRPLGGEG